LGDLAHLLRHDHLLPIPVYHDGEDKLVPLAQSPSGFRWARVFADTVEVKVHSNGKTAVADDAVGNSRIWELLDQYLR